MTYALHSTVCTHLHRLMPTTPLLGTDTEAPSLLENDQALFLKGSCWITAGWPFNWGSHEYLTFHSLSGVGKQMRRGSLFEKHDCTLHFFLKKMLRNNPNWCFLPVGVKTWRYLICAELSQRFTGHICFKINWYSFLISLHTLYDSLLALHF